MRDQIEEALKKALLLEEQKSYQTLIDSVHYSLIETGGKRIRPHLLLTVAHDLELEEAPALSLGVALEMIHTYSLIHDDLPCMDNDDTRRGKPTLHKCYPEWQALLSGDYLLTKAFEVLANIEGVEPQKQVAIISLFASKSGAAGMIGGQVIDLLYTGKELNKKMIEEMHLLKTGALFEIAILAPLILKGVEEENFKLLQQFATIFGLLYQIIDDLDDKTGKDSDRKNKKSTYATLFSPGEVKEHCHLLYQTGEELLKKVPFSMNYLTEFYRHIFYHRIFS
jgi:geranylgeranyl diphosphate synthase type II